MNKGGGQDLIRQVANVAGALFQIGAPVLTSEAVGRVSAENGTLVVPADYAFSIWALIFLLCLAFTSKVLGRSGRRTKRTLSPDTSA